MKGNLKPCLDCGRASYGSRCPEHTKQRVRAAKQKYGGGWRTLSKQTISAAGPTCPLCGEDYTPENPATTDHVKPGSIEQGVRAICRRCNSRLGGQLNGQG